MSFLSPQDKLVLEKTKKSIQFVDSHYRISIPWKGDSVYLPDNYSVAVNRLKNLEKRLAKNPEVARSYQETIKQHLEKGYIRQVNPSEKSHRQWYLPHFAIVKKSRLTTKTRIVFDASAQCDGVSLNDAIHQGPKLQKELYQVLLRFRKLPVALICDIAEMYLQIKLYPQDRPSHRFLWRNLSLEEDIKEYEFDRLVFRLNCSPFLAQLMTQHHAKIYQERYPMASEIILKSTYMDDSMTSVVSEVRESNFIKSYPTFGQGQECMPINGYQILMWFLVRFQ